MPPPRPLTPDELDAVHKEMMEEHPDARKAWDERDEVMRREAEERQRLMQRGQEALEHHETAAKPLPGAQPAPAPPQSPKAKESPKATKEKPTTKKK
jgi:hypothetical protein